MSDGISKWYETHKHPDDMTFEERERFEQEERDREWAKYRENCKKDETIATLRAELAECKKQLAARDAEAQTLAGQVVRMRNYLENNSSMLEFMEDTEDNEDGAITEQIKENDRLVRQDPTHTEQLVKAAMELADAANEAELAWDVNDMDWYDAAVAKRDKSICAYRALKEGK